MSSDPMRHIALYTFIYSLKLFRFFRKSKVFRDVQEASKQIISVANVT